MSAEAVSIAGVVLSAPAVILCIVIIYRSARAPSAISPILDQRLINIEGAIERSDTTTRDEFGRGRDEARESSRSLREEVTGLFERLSGALRASLNDLSVGQKTQLDAFGADLTEAKTAAAADARNLREEIQLTLKQLGESIGNRIGDLVIAHGEKLDGVTGQITTLTEGNERRQEVLRSSAN